MLTIILTTLVFLILLVLCIYVIKSDKYYWEDWGSFVFGGTFVFFIICIITWGKKDIEVTNVLIKPDAVIYNEEGVRVVWKNKTELYTNHKDTWQINDSTEWFVEETTNIFGIKDFEQITFKNK